MVGGRKGTVMFVGPAQFAGGGVVVGMRLDEKVNPLPCILHRRSQTL